MSRRPRLNWLLCITGIVTVGGCGVATDTPTDNETSESQQSLSLAASAVKPIADTLVSGVTGVGDATALWKNVDDGITAASSDDDTTYVRSTSSSAIHGVRFGGGRAGTVGQAILHYRARAASATGTVTATLKLGSQVLGTRPQHALSSTWTDFTDTFNDLAVADLKDLSAEVNLRRTSGSGDVRYTMIWLEATLYPISHTVQVLLYKDIDTCVIGSACAGTSCTGLFDDAQALLEKFENDGNFRAVSPDSSECTTAPKSKRIRITMDAAEVAERRNQIDLYRANVFRWSNHELNLKVNVQELGSTKMSLSNWSGGLWIGPWDIDPKGRSAISRYTDYTIVTQGIRDATLGLHHGLGGCGGTFGGDLGVSGAGHSWIPQTAPAYSFNCSDEGVYTHEWLHQVHWGLNVLTGFSDLYNNQNYPACGAGDPDTSKWFPDTHSCTSDPDAPYCGAAICGSNDLVNSHVLSAHWPAGRVLKANHCRNGVLDFNETAVDVGPDCPAPINRTPAASKVTASANDGNVPSNTVDNNLGTRWSAIGSGNWLRFDLGTTRRVTHVSVAVYNGSSRRNDFDLQVSTNGTNWTTVWSGLSSGDTTAQESYDFPDVDTRYVRYFGRGHYASDGTYSNKVSVTEVDIFGL